MHQNSRSIEATGDRFAWISRKAYFLIGLYLRDVFTTKVRPVKMDLKNHIEQIVEKILKPERDLYAVELKVIQDDRIRLVLDSDQRLTLSECIRIHKQLELQIQHFDGALNYSIEVTSVGIGSPLTLKRQYYKRIGRQLTVLTHENETVKGKLTRVDEQAMEFLWKTREKKEIGKGKKTVVHRQWVEYDQIIKAKEVV